MSEVVKIEEPVVTPLDELKQNAELPQDDPNYDTQLAASTTFGLYVPKFMSLVSQLSSRQLKRLVKSLVAYPLENIEINKKNLVEHEAYKMGHQLLESKYLMILAYTFEEEEKRKIRAEEFKKSQEAQKVSETKTTDSSDLPKDSK